MKFFLDTANVEEIREAAAMGLVDGITTNPTNYGNPVDSSSGGGNAATIGHTRRELNAGAENPGQYVWDDSDEWIALTMAIPPAVAAAAAPVIRRRQLTTVRM